MSDERQGGSITWSNAGLRASILGVCHLSVLIPLLLLPVPFIPNTLLLFVGWVVIDQLLIRYDMSLIAAVSRLRLVGRGGLRSNKSRRKHQKIRRRLN